MRTTHSSNPAGVSVILVNFNSGELGATAARSVRGQVGVDIELVVVDNASHDDSLQQIISAAAPDVVVRHQHNVGYAAGVNAGFRASSRQFVMPLNCDAAIDRNYCAAALDRFAQQPRAGIVGGVVETVSTGHRRGPLTVSRTMRVRELPFDGPMKCLRVDGSCGVWRRSAIDEVVAAHPRGPLDEVFFVYGETIDLAFKLAALGWETWFDPALRAEHVRSFASSVRVADKRGPLREMVLASRHVNAARHSGRRFAPVVRGLLFVQDSLFAVTGPWRGDRAAFADVRGGWRRARRMLVGELPSERG